MAASQEPQAAESKALKRKKSKAALAEPEDDVAEQEAPRKKRKVKADTPEDTAEPEAQVPKKKKSKESVEGDASTEPQLSAEAFRKKFEITSARKDKELPDPVQSFEEAPFSKKLRKALMDAGFPAPSPIQAQGWPIAVQGEDLVAVAKTGSGKTVGFLLPAFRRVAESAGGSSAAKGKGAAAHPLVLVLAPTRELATQIEAESARFGDCVGIKSLAVFGGVPKGPQAKACKEQPQVLVATPGRLQDLMEMGMVNLSKVEFLVLDEADRMLDMGFEPEIAKILDTVPASRQTMLFTATWPKAVQRVAKNYLREDHAHVNVGQTEELAANTAVSQEFYKLDDDEKDTKLWRILAHLDDSAKLICFANTKRRIDALQKTFREKGYESVALHGDKAQWERDRDLAEFAKGNHWLLFATDVCARGLDIKDVTHVVNFDMARDVEGYVHRIGRTGRAGRTGVSITFWNPAYDMECAPALAKIAREAGQSVPEFLEKAAEKQKQVKNKAWRY
eukprot:CAMPEP_0195107080 /NCGR_PEP_ID=MMETSP0448-20130528/81873_1 /TAXON_ID=66468 /ORGANISM="Heterocapsa triquestra, Strain CCMP 448" /LENGTH=505 /DNA_ID=CAMNT_0040143475 /DNA_START=75 /DNA_END=1592 /DNA_ORIENTATION=-